MSNNFITNSAENATLKKRLKKLILASQELKIIDPQFPLTQKAYDNYKIE